MLDAACGAGLALDWLDLRGGHRYVGIARSPSMLAEARRVATRRDFTDVRLVVGDITAMPDGRAEVALCYNALHYVADPRAALDEVARCLAPGGRLLGSALVRGGSARADRLLAADPTMGPGGTTGDLRRWLDEAGLTSVVVIAADAMATFEAQAPGRLRPRPAPVAR